MKTFWKRSVFVTSISLALAIFITVAPFAWAQSTREWVGHMAFRQLNPVVSFNGVMRFKTLAGTDLFAVTSTGAQIGIASGTAVTQLRMYRAALTPTASSAFLNYTWSISSSMSQTFTVTGLAVKDTIFVNGPAPTAGCAMSGAAVSAADTMRVVFSINTSVACTPAAGIYSVFAIQT